MSFVSIETTVFLYSYFPITDVSKSIKKRNLGKEKGVMGSVLTGMRRDTGVTWTTYQCSDVIQKDGVGRRGRRKREKRGKLTKIKIGKGG